MITKWNSSNTGSAIETDTNTVKMYNLLVISSPERLIYSGQTNDLKIKIEEPKRQIPSNRMKSLISDLLAISKLLKHSSLSPKLRKLQTVRIFRPNVKFRQICMILLISDMLAISKLLRHFSLSPKLRKLQNTLITLL